MTTSADRGARGRVVAGLSAAAALVAFAGNSILCRLALGSGAIDPITFSAVRLASGAAALVAILAIRSRSVTSLRGSWVSAVTLFLYAVPFSVAYLDLGAGTGALILFGSVQITMMAVAMEAGERPSARHWTGLAAALVGLVYLVLPGVTAPSLRGAALMAVAGVAWGVYTLRGRMAGDAIAETTGNFVRAAPMAVVLGAVTIAHAYADVRGLTLAMASGAMTSGMGYVLWYAALGAITAARAAIIQLAVPILAALGGAAYLGESLSVRFAVASVLVLGGIGVGMTREPRQG
jgi:drug/metabolite transporter (DMT)-like permease